MGITDLLFCLGDATIGVSLQIHYRTGIHQLQSSFYQLCSTQEEIGFKEQGRRDISKTLLILFFSCNLCCSKSYQWHILCCSHLGIVLDKNHILCIIDILWQSKAILKHWAAHLLWTTFHNIQNRFVSLSCFHMGEMQTTVRLWDWGPGIFLLLILSLTLIPSLALGKSFHLDIFESPHL